MASFNNNWPRWPAEAAGKKMAHVGVALDIDTLFRTLYAPASAFVVSSVKALRKSSAATLRASDETESNLPHGTWSFTAAGKCIISVAAATQCSALHTRSRFSRAVNCLDIAIAADAILHQLTRKDARHYMNLGLAGQACRSSPGQPF